MLRDLRHKYVYYVGVPSQLFDLEADPEELTDLGTDSAHARQRTAFETQLRDILDPEVVDKEAKADQARMAEQYGGLEMLRRREKMAFTPPPTAGAH
jgi:choline-sulfatase